MNIGKIMNMITDNDINPEDIFALVEKIKDSDLKDEDNLRSVIREVSKIAKKPVDKTKEDKLVRKIIDEGIDEDIFGMI